MRKKDETKNGAIYDSTLQLVLEKGLAGVTMCDISKAAGIATGTLYIYFSSKEVLMNDLFAVCRAESAGYYMKDHEANDSFEHAFKKFFSNILNYRLLNFEKFIFLEQCYHSPFISDEVRKDSLKYLSPLFTLLHRGKADGIVKDIDDILLLGYIIGPINEVVKKAHYGNMKLDQKKIDQLYTLCYDGLLA